jgi:hypothetical protein
VHSPILAKIEVVTRDVRRAKLYFPVIAPKAAKIKEKRQSVRSTPSPSARRRCGQWPRSGLEWGDPNGRPVVGFHGVRLA